MIDSLSTQQKEAILNAIYARRKIEAIKLVRESAGGGLKEAKDFVEKYSDELEAKSPEKFAPKAKGCSVALTTLVVLAALGFMIVRAVQKN